MTTAYNYTSPNSQPYRRTAPDSAEYSASKRPRIEECTDTFAIHCVPTCTYYTAGYMAAYLFTILKTYDLMHVVFMHACMGTSSRVLKFYAYM